MTIILKLLIFFIKMIKTAVASVPEMTVGQTAV